MYVNFNDFTQYYAQPSPKYYGLFSIVKTVEQYFVFKNREIRYGFFFFLFEKTILPIYYRK